MRSMTGFATTAGEADGAAWRWDLKSVNARGLDLRFRLPPGFDALEGPCRLAAQKRLARGAVSATLQVRPARDAAAAPPLDEAALIDRIAALGRIRRALDDAGLPLAPLTGEALLAALDATTAPEAAALDGPALREATRAGFDAALAALHGEREAEGRRIQRAILEQTAQIDSLTRDAAAVAAEATRALRDRLKARIDALTADRAELSAERLEAEAAALAAKADVQEEIDRLASHVAAAQALLEDPAPVGRQLDFLAQEFNREANTLCSKSASQELTRIGLSLKLAIDQLREQAANVE